MILALLVTVLMSFSASSGRLGLAVSCRPWTGPLPSAGTVRPLLAWFRKMVDQPPGEESVVDVRTIAEEALALVETTAEEKGVTLELAGEDRLAALGEPRAIVQILVNLLGNAIRHSPSASVVTLNLAHGSEFASITVSDQGKGIAPTDQERIFERFERGENDGTGAGLGLAIARRLAHSMQGDITLVSTPGEGASFTLSLPLA